MKLRFFTTILLVLSLTVVGVTLVYSKFSINERQRLLDQQIESHATLLLSSGLSSAELEDFEEADNIVTDILGGDRINHVIVIYDQKGKAIYRNKNATLINMNLPNQEPWSTQAVGQNLIRILTVPFPVKKRVLQIGLVLNSTLDRWEILRQRTTAYVLLIMTMALIISFGLTTLLVRPVKILARYLKHITDHFESGFSLNDSQTGTTSLGLLPGNKLFFGQKDEFTSLTSALQELLGKVKSALKANNTRSAQLAHELKTPLTIIKNHIEDLKKSEVDKSKCARLSECLEETDHLSTIITAFLEWSVVENTPGVPEDIHALKLTEIVDDILKNFTRLYPGRIELSKNMEVTVFAKPTHLDQVITNLLMNALKYSPSNSQIQVKILAHSLEITNQGKGVPKQVLQRIGAPFNIGTQSKEDSARGSGLGLAWVMTLCVKYKWKFTISNGQEGTMAKVMF